jgi:hypothetical protein
MDRPERSHDRIFDRESAVARQQRAETPVLHLEHDGILVRPELPIYPSCGGVQEYQPHTIYDEGVASTGGTPRRPGGIDRRQMLTVQGRRQWLPRFQHEARCKRGRDRRRPSQVIGVAVRHDQGIQLPDALTP